MSVKGLQVFADVDLDGDLDLVVSGQPIKLYLNDGNGNFQDSTATNVPPNSGGMVTSLAVGDVDKDGHVDIMVGTATWLPGSPPSHLLMNDGSGKFSLVAYGISRGPMGIKSAVFVDIDKDGFLDLVEVADVNGASGVFVSFNDKKGNYSAVRSIRLLGSLLGPQSLAVADFNGDQFADIFVCDFYPSFGSSQLFVNDGKGGFTPGLTFGMARLAVAGDVDNDGDLDLIVSLDKSLRLYLNEGSGSRFSLDPRKILLDPTCSNHNFLFLGDLDGDNDLDLFCPPGVMHVFSSGKFQLLSGDLFPGDAIGGIVFGDVDMDGDVDLLASGIMSDYFYRNHTRHLDYRLSGPAIGAQFVPVLYSRVPDFGGVPRGSILMLGIAEKKSNFSPFGVLGLDPIFIYLVSSKSTGPSGNSVAHPISIPLDLSLQGQDLILQGLVDGLRFWRFTNVLVEKIN